MIAIRCRDLCKNGKVSIEVMQVIVKYYISTLPPVRGQNKNNCLAPQAWKSVPRFVYCMLTVKMNCKNYFNLVNLKVLSLCLAYRIFSNKRHGAYLIFRATQVRRLFKRCT